MELGVFEELIKVYLVADKCYRIKYIWLNDYFPVVAIHKGLIMIITLVYYSSQQLGVQL